MNTLETTLSLDTVTIGAFYKVVETGNVKILGEDVTDEMWAGLYDSYYERAGLRVHGWKDWIKLQNLVLKREYIAMLLEILKKRDGNFNDCKKALLDWGYVMDDGPLEKNLERFHRNLGVLDTKIKILKDDMPEEKAELNIWKEAVLLKKHFKVGIDPNTTSCSEWIEWKKQYVEDARSS